VFSPEELFDLTKTEHSKIYAGLKSAWEALPLIRSYIEDFFKENAPKNQAQMANNVFIGERVWVGRETLIEPNVTIKGPAVIGNGCQIRAGAYIRENVIIGNNCTIGNSCEFKNSLLHDDSEVPHFAYVGDSLLGWKSHLGAGVKVSNLKIDRTNVKVKTSKIAVETGLRKFGCILGDQAEVGCNSVLNPGTILGKRTMAVTNLALAGFYPEGSFIKLRQEQVVVKRR
jgi:NDP-sugar pyrophosphorylase family protein